MNPNAFRIAQQAQESSRSRSFSPQTRPSLLRARSLEEEAARTQADEKAFTASLIEKCAKLEGLTVEEFLAKSKA